MHDDGSQIAPKASTSTPPPKLVVLVSGYGSNLQAIIDAVESVRLHATISAVISDHCDAHGLDRARMARIPAVCRPFAPYRGRPEARLQYDRDLAEAIASYAPDLIVLAGWMRLLSTAFLDCFPGQVINLHPALPGMFPGAHAIAEAHAAAQAGRVDHTGVMVHFVVPEMDAGPVIATEVVPIYPVDTLDDLERRIHETEHTLLIRAIDGLLRSRTLVSPSVTSEGRPS